MKKSSKFSLIKVLILCIPPINQSFQFAQYLHMFEMFSHKVVGVVATPDAVWHRDSHYLRKFEGGGTKDTDLNKGVIGRNFAKFLRRRNRGGQGHSDPLMRINKDK